MPVKAIIAFILFLWAIGCTITNKRYYIYLGDNANSHYESANIVTNITDTYPYVDFLGYHTMRYESLKDSFVENVKLAGLVLSAKSILVDQKKAAAVFGNETDSCILQYDVTKEQTRNGRSATLSVLNLFSKKENKVPQHEPEISMKDIASTGTIHFHDQSAAFYYKHRFDKNPQHEGWLVLNKDTIMIRPVNNVTDETGKIIKPHKNFTGGFELIKAGITYAAFDCNNSGTRQFFILKQADQIEKNTIAAYLFIVACDQ